MSCTKMDRPSDIEVLCRLCLVKDQVHIPIFEEQGDIRQIFLKISCCLPVSISREDNLPKKICDNCSNKLDSLYEFWNTSVNAEKTLLSWLGQAGVKYTDNAISAVVQQITKPETEIKIEDETIEDGEVEPIEINDKDDEAEEIDDGEVENFDDGEVEDIEDDEPPPPKRARRSAALKAQETLANISDDDEDEEFDTAELVTEVKEESDESEGEVKDPSILNAVPGTSANDQPGPSGLGKNGPDAPFFNNSTKFGFDEIRICLEREPLDIKDESFSIPNNDDMPLNVEENFVFCDKSFENKDRLVDHNVKQLSKNRKDNLTKHSKRKHSSNSETFKCDICDRSFNRKNDLRSHIKRKHIRNNEIFECESCDKSFNRKDYLRLHTKRKHSSNNETFKCDICDRFFNCKDYLRSHMKRQHLRNNEKFKCKFCENSFTRKDYLLVHTKLKHSQNKETYKCEFCDKSFNFKEYLLQHIRRVHSRKNEIYYKCGFCDNSFKCENYLLSHIERQHSTNEKFKCDFCDKLFNG